MAAGLHAEFAAKQQIHVLGTCATGPSLVWLLWGFGQPNRLLLWLAAHLVATAILAVVFHHAAHRSEPYATGVNPVTVATVVSAITTGSIVWFDHSSAMNPAYAFGLCACITAFCAGCFVNLHPVASLIRLNIFPALLQVAAGLFLADQSEAAACLIAFVAIVGLKPLCVIRESFENQVRLREEATWNAQHDPMTGLLNRAGLREILGCAQTLLYIDLDGFKAVNDRHGHSAGDKLLCETAQRIVDATAQVSAEVARLGGDEFLILLQTTDRDEANEIAQSVLRALREPFSIGESISASIGVAFTGIEGTATTAIDRADRALYSAKANPDNSVAWHGLSVAQADATATTPPQSIVGGDPETTAPRRLNLEDVAGLDDSFGGSREFDDLAVGPDHAVVSDRSGLAPSHPVGRHLPPA